ARLGDDVLLAGEEEAEERPRRRDQQRVTQEMEEPSSRGHGINRGDGIVERQANLLMQICNSTAFRLSSRCSNQNSGCSSRETPSTVWFGTRCERRGHSLNRFIVEVSAVAL